MITSTAWFDNLQEVLARVELACDRAGRDPHEVRVLLATKTVSAEILKDIAHHGHHLFGENKVQELKQKFDLLKDVGIEWHMIGHLQTNKVKDVLLRSQWIHSLDRMELALEINKRAKDLRKTASVLVEVNTSGETTKHGLHPDEVLTFCEQIQNLDHIRVRGLMTLATNSADEKTIRGCFKTLKNKFNEVKSKNFSNHEMTELSMGMSNDFEWAIAEGATILRIGSAVFGARA